MRVKFDCCWLKSTVECTVKECLDRCLPSNQTGSFTVESRSGNIGVSPSDRVCLWEREGDINSNCQDTALEFTFSLTKKLNRRERSVTRMWRSKKRKIPGTFSLLSISLLCVTVHKRKFNGGHRIDMSALLVDCVCIWIFQRRDTCLADMISLIQQISLFSCQTGKPSRSISHAQATVHSLELLLRGNASCHGNSCWTHKYMAENTSW